MSQDKAEELLQSSKEQKRHSSDPETASTQSLERAVAAAYHDLDDGELHENLTVRDENLAALIAGLEATGRVEDVGRRACERLDRDAEIDSRAALLKALLRVGLQEVAAEELADAKSGRRTYIQEKESESGF